MPSNPLRVNELEVCGFRGISSRLLVDFRPPGSDAASMMISGDNGTGKSSIVDALEFALQGRLLRNRLIRALSASSGSCWTEVRFSDGTTLRREANDSPGVPHPDYGVSPFVIRRADIEEFWSMPPRLRLRAFRQYLRPQAPPGKSATSFPSRLTERDGTRIRDSHLLRSDVKARQVSCIVASEDSYIVQHGPRRLTMNVVRIRRAVRQGPPRPTNVAGRDDDDSRRLTASG